MNMPEMTNPVAPSPAIAVVLRHRLRAAVNRIGARRLLIGLGFTAAGVGVALNWGWLTAVGVAPVLLSLAPCAAMCALGLCMPKMMGGGNSCAGGQTGAALERAAGPAGRPPSNTAPT